MTSTRRVAGGRLRTNVRRFLALVLMGLFLAASARLFIWPRRDRLGPADAIVILGGGGRRRPVGYELARRGLAKTLLVSTSDTAKELRGLPALPGVEVVKFRPEPFSTQGEAQFIADTAKAHGWSRVIVVAGRSQVTRARLRVGRCFTGEVAVASAPIQVRWLPYDIAYEWGALAKALFLQRGC